MRRGVRLPAREFDPHPMHRPESGYVVRNGFHLSPLPSFQFLLHPSYAINFRVGYAPLLNSSGISGDENFPGKNLTIDIALSTVSIIALKQFAPGR